MHICQVGKENFFCFAGKRGDAGFFHCQRTYRARMSGSSNTAGREGVCGKFCFSLKERLKKKGFELSFCLEERSRINVPGRNRNNRRGRKNAIPVPLCARGNSVAAFHTFHRIPQSGRSCRAGGGKLRTGAQPHRPARRENRARAVLSLRTRHLSDCGVSDDLSRPQLHSRSRKTEGIYRRTRNGGDRHDADHGDVPARHERMDRKARSRASGNAGTRALRRSDRRPVRRTRI